MDAGLAEVLLFSGGNQAPGCIDDKKTRVAIEWLTPFSIPDTGSRLGQSGVRQLAPPTDR